MLNKFKKNVAALAAIQSIDYILALILLPYLARILGSENYGLLAFAMAVTGLFSIIIDYGFNLSAVRQVSILRGNKQEINKIYTSIVIIKSLLMFFCALILFILINVIDKIGQEWEVFVLYFLGIMGQILFPVWLFQAEERMSIVARINLISKIFYLLLVIGFVNNKDSYILVPAFNIVSILISGVASLWVIKYRMKYGFEFPEYFEIVNQLKIGFNPFISKISIGFFARSTPFILGVITTNAIVGQYAIADKIIQVLKSLFQPIIQAAYPYLSRKINDDAKSAFRFINKILVVAIFTYVPASMVTFYFSKELLIIVGGPEYADSEKILQMMSILPLIVSLSGIYIINGLYSLGKYSVVTKFLSFAAVFNLAITFFLTRFFGINGAVISNIITELVVLFFSIFYFKRFCK